MNVVMFPKAFNKGKIFESVVRLLPVEMVDQSTRRNLAVRLFPDPTVFKNALAGRKREANVANAHDAAMATGTTLQFGFVGVEA